MKLSQSAQINAQGVACLASGNYKAAFRAFGEAAAILQSVAARAADVDVGSGTTTTDATTNAAVGAVSLSLGVELDHLKAKDLYIFNRGIVFQTREEATGDSTTPSRSRDDRTLFCVAVTLFNMALGHHGLAVRTGKDACVRKALSLYSATIEVVQNLRSDQSECLKIIAIAALNNMSHLYYELGNIGKATSLLEIINPLASNLSEATAFQCRVDECFMNLHVTKATATARCA